MNIINHGTWSRYEPAEIPQGYPDGVVYAKRDRDGADWYRFLYSEDPAFQPGSIKLVAMNEGGRWIIKVACEDATRMFPLGQLLLEVPAENRTDGDDPQAYFGGKMYDQAADAFIEAPPSPPAVPQAISRRQFYQQLAIAGIITPQQALDAVRVGAIPAPLQAILDAQISDAAENSQLKCCSRAPPRSSACIR